MESIENKKAYAKLAGQLGISEDHICLLEKGERVEFKDARMYLAVLFKQEIRSLMD